MPKEFTPEHTPIPEGILRIWDNLSPQMQASIKAFGWRTAPLTRASFTDEQWNRLSYQFRASIVARPSMEEEERKKLGL